VPSIGLLSKLFAAIASENQRDVEQIATEIIADEEKKGHSMAARHLRGSLNPNSARTVSNGLGVPTALKLLSDPFVDTADNKRLRNIFLPDPARRELETIVKEWRVRDVLKNLNIPRRSRILFYGPPGCGKSVTASALGAELGVPTFLVRFDAIIGAYLGQTAVHLRQLFQFAEHNPCVLVVDEVDALGKRRGNPLDVGELDRIVIAFMQELEHTIPAGLVIATSNLPTELDPALWRRFDFTMQFPRPRKRDLHKFVKMIASTYRIQIRPKSLDKMHATSYADAQRFVESEVRNTILRRTASENGRAATKSYAAKLLPERTA
jgi:SpoVK/Ycf46/Vps4 family AAA+-type ATPase